MLLSQTGLAAWLCTSMTCAVPTSAVVTLDGHANSPNPGLVRTYSTQICIVPANTLNAKPAVSRVILLRRHVLVFFWLQPSGNQCMVCKCLDLQNASKVWCRTSAHGIVDAGGSYTTGRTRPFLVQSWQREKVHSQKATGFCRGRTTRVRTKKQMTLYQISTALG